MAMNYSALPKRTIRKTYDIIIPHYGLTTELNEKCLRCLQSVRQHSKDYKLLFIDNAKLASPDVNEELAKHEHCVAFRNYSNLGFVGGVNQALFHVSNAPFVVLLNNDAMAVPGWLEKLHEPFERPNNVGIVGPRTTTPNSWQGRYKPSSEGWMLLPFGRMLAFFCVMIKRECLKEVGFCHEGFDQFAGFGGDDYMCAMAERAGWRLALQQDLIIPHDHRSTFKTLHDEATIKRMQNAALEHFRSKL